MTASVRHSPSGIRNRLPTRKGKVAHLPASVREELNIRMNDGATGPQLTKWLRTLDNKQASAITEQNLSEWRKGGFQDWLNTEQRMDSIRRKAELSMRMARAAGGSLGETIIAQIAGKIDERLDALTDAELENIKPLLDSILAAEKLKLDRLRVAQKDEEIELSRKKFQRETCELLIQYHDDEKVQKVLESSSDKEVKMEALVNILFGQRPESVERPPRT